MARAKKREELTIAPNTLLGGLLGASSGRKAGWKSLLLEESIYPSLRRMWNKPLGRVTLYALGIRPTQQDVEEERERKPRSTRRRSTTNRSIRR